MIDKVPINIAKSWIKLVEEFRSFGGIANNIFQREGAHGLGLFPIDANQIVELYAPNSLLVSTDNIELYDGKVLLKDHSVHPKGFGDWYQKFQAEYSWGAEAQTNIQRFENKLENLPSNLLKLFNTLGILNQEKRFFSSSKSQNTFERFIKTRQISKGGKLVLMPIIELVNHSPIRPAWLISEEGISVKGTHSNEVLVRYSVSDPLRRFIQYGFNCEEPTGFSLNVDVLHRGKKFKIIGGTNPQHLKPAEMSVNHNIIIIRQPLLGSVDNPRYPRKLFKKMLNQINGINSDELFDQVYMKNRLALVMLLRELETNNNEFISQIEKACYQQIDAISKHF